MKIQSIHINRFGSWRDIRFRRLSPRIQVFYGPNEAGKTTFLQFLRAIFYGLEDRISYAPAPNPDQPDEAAKPFGGELFVSIEAEEGRPARRLKIKRQGILERIGDSYDVAEKIEVTDNLGNVYNPDLLSELLGGMDQDLFNHIFAMNLQDLRKISVLNKSEAAQVLYQLSSQPPSRSLLELEGDFLRQRQLLEGNLSVEEASRLESPSSPQLQAPPQSLAALIRQRQIQEARQNDAFRERQETDQLRSQIERRQAELRNLEDQIRQSREYRELIDAACKAYPVWEQIQQYRKGGDVSSADPAAYLLSPDKLKQLDDLESQRNKLNQRRHKQREECLKLKDQAKENEPDGANWTLLGAQIRVLTDQGDWYKKILRRQAEIQQELENAQRQQIKLDQTAQEDVAISGTPFVQANQDEADPLAQYPRLSDEWINRLKQFAQAVRQAQQNLKLAVEANKKIVNRAQGFQNQLGEHTSEFGNLTVDQITQRIKNRLSLLRDKKQLLINEKDLIRGNEQSTRQLGELNYGDPVPQPIKKTIRWTTWICLVVMLFWILCLTGLISKDGGTGLVIYSAAVISVIVLVGAIVTREMYKKAAEDKILSQKQQWKSIQNQMDNIRKQRDKIEQELRENELPFEDPSAQWGEADDEAANVKAAIEALQKKLLSLENVSVLDRQYQMTRSELENGEADVQAARKEYKKAHSLWKHALEKARLPEDWTPENVKKLQIYQKQAHFQNQLQNQLQEQLKAKQARIQAEIQAVSPQQKRFLEEELNNKRQEIESFRERVDKLASQIGFQLEDNDDPLGFLQVLDSEIAQKAQQRTQTLNARKAYRTARAALDKIQNQYTVVKQKIEFLLQQLGVQNRDELMTRLEQNRQLAQRRSSVETLQKRLDTILGAFAGNRQLESLLADSPQIDFITRKIEVQNQQINEQTQRLDQLRNQIQSDNQTLRDLEVRLASGSGQDRSLDQIDKAIEESTRRWQTLAVAQLLIHKLRRTFEKERQPQTLEEASRYFRSMTRGRYTRIWAPSQEPYLMVDRKDGKTFDVAQLSSGTTEQLYLSLRLALTAYYSRRGVKLPMILDDVLVNFDNRRAAATAKALKSFVRKEDVQIILFTCHEHIRNIFVNRGVKDGSNLLQKNDSRPAEGKDSGASTTVRERKPTASRTKKSASDKKKSKNQWIQDYWRK